MNVFRHYCCMDYYYRAAAATDELVLANRTLQNKPDSNVGKTSGRLQQYIRLIETEKDSSYAVV